MSCTMMVECLYPAKVVVVVHIVPVNVMAEIALHLEADCWILKMSSRLRLVMNN